MATRKFALMDEACQHAYLDGRHRYRAGLAAKEGSLEWAFLLGWKAEMQNIHRHPELLVPAIPPVPTRRTQMIVNQFFPLPPDPKAPKVTEIVIDDQEGIPDGARETYEAADGSIWYSEEDAHKQEQELGLPLSKFVRPGKSA